eukprot:4590825-Prymnesium_polylepis.1
MRGSMRGHVSTRGVGLAWVHVHVAARDARGALHLCGRARLRSLRGASHTYARTRAHTYARVHRHIRQAEDWRGGRRIGWATGWDTSWVLGSEGDGHMWGGHGEESTPTRGRVEHEP